MHAQIHDGQVAEWPIINLRQRLPHISLPLDLTDTANLPDGFVWVTPLAPPAYDQHTHKLVPFAPRMADGRWVSGYTVTPLSPEEAAAAIATTAASARAERNARLAACDWTQLPDAPVDSAVWAAYRQALRDVSAQPGFPVSVVWPEPPA